jgi:uncharacterized Zn-binding protein involved in type VI secretion
MAEKDYFKYTAGEKPAARITDMHTCPSATGPVPHVGGPIIGGSPNVFIGGLPAARVTDPVTCVGPPDTIVVGSATVFINGLPAARMGDQTHMVVLLWGAPNGSDWCRRWWPDGGSWQRFRNIRPSFDTDSGRSHREAF